MYPDFPYELIQIADTRKPFLPDERFHFSISHCGDFAAVIVSRTHRVGIDIEIPVDVIGRIRDKFLSPEELETFGLMAHPETDYSKMTLLWSAKEAVFKWYGLGGVDFRKHIRLMGWEDNNAIRCRFEKNETHLYIHYAGFDQLVLAWVIS